MTERRDVKQDHPASRVSDDTQSQGGETKHTPGPWRAEKHPQHDHVHCSELWTIIAGEPDDCSDAEIAQVIAYEAEANARLIAAAPDLLAALQSAKDIMENEEWWHDPLDGLYPTRFVIEEAIAKAEGRS